MVKSSNKGFGYEREVSTTLSYWWTHGKNDDVFWRTGGSGGRATTRRKKGKDTKYQYGDITFTDPIGKPLIDYFLIECKRGYSNAVDVLDCIDISPKRKKLPEITEWWDKAQVEKSIGDRREVLIIIRRNNRRAIVLTSCKFIAEIEGYCGEVFDKYIQIGGNKIIVLFEDFLNFVTPETIIMLLNK